MEFIVVVAVIAVIILILGVSMTMVAKALLVISGIVLVLMLVFFAAMSVMLLFSKKAEGEFDGFEKKGEGSFETAWYKLGEERLPNIFPAENFMRKQIYQSGVHKMRRLSLGKRSFAIDDHSILIILMGLWLTGLSTALVVFVMRTLELYNV